MEALGGSCVFTSEWDKHCRITYASWFGVDPHGDLRDVDPAKIPSHEILCGGFPCQPFSIAGISKRNSIGRKHGFDCEGQGRLFFQICDALAAKRPPVFLLENVKNLQSHNRGDTWRVIREVFGEWGYDVHAGIVDGAAWVPQHRERIFIVGFRRAAFRGKIDFTFPKPRTDDQQRVGAILEEYPDAGYTLSDRLWACLQTHASKHQSKGNGFGFGIANPKSISRTLTARYHKDGAEILIAQGSNKNPRRLTPREAARLMGFP